MKSSTLVVILVAVIAIGSILTSYIKSFINKSFAKVVQSGDIKSFDVMSQKKLNQFFIAPYNMEYMRLNCLMFANKQSDINKQIKKMLNMRKNKKQDKDLSMRAFNYYVGIEDKTQSKNILEHVKEVCSEQQIHEAQMMYDIYILKKGNHIQEFEELYESSEGEQRAAVAYLIMTQHKNNGDFDKAKVYEDEYNKLMKELNFK